MSSSWFSARIARFPQPIAQARRYGTFGSLTAQRAIPLGGRAARTLRPVARVLVTRRVSEGGLDPLVAAGHEIFPPQPDDVPLSPEELAAAASQVDGIVCQLTDRIDEAVLRAGLPRLRVVADVAVGYDNIDVPTASELGIAVCNTPGVLDET